jgi:hypothetical protein
MFSNERENKSERQREKERETERERVVGGREGGVGEREG